MGRRVALGLVPVLGLLAGLLGAVAFPDQFGPEHPCPFGAPAASCYYPPDLVRQKLIWAAFGLFIGVLATWLLWTFWEPAGRGR